MAYHDGLTDLPNRAAFLQALTQMIEACDGTDGGIRGAVGRPRRPEGNQRRVRPRDRRQAADRGGAPDRDRVARRRGGAAQRRRVRPDHRRQAAGRRHASWPSSSRARWREGFQIDGKSVRIGVTTGISIFPHNGPDAASLLANAGAALFRAKAKIARLDQRLRSPRWTSRSATAACCIRISPRRSGTARSRCTTSRRPAAAARPATTTSSASRRWRAGSIRPAASCRRATSFRWRKKAG